MASPTTLEVCLSPARLLIPTTVVPDGVGNEINNLEPSEKAGRSTCKWGRAKAMVYECVCGEMVAPADIEAKTRVVECKKRGCKMRYVSTLSLLSREQNGYLVLNDSFTFIVQAQSLTIRSTTGSARGMGKTKDLENDAIEWFALEAKIVLPYKEIYSCNS